MKTHILNFTRPMNDGEVTYNFPTLTWRKYQFAMVGSGKATITITLPNGITMTKYPSSLPSTGNQLVIDEENPTACVFSASGGARLSRLRRQVESIRYSSHGKRQWRFHDDGEQPSD